MSNLLWPDTFGPSFEPEEMLKMGVFEGRYIGAIVGSPALPKEWFSYASVLSDRSRIKYPPDPTINYYGVKSRQPMSVWRENGWLTKESPNGWFEWYIKFFLGKRITKKQKIKGVMLYEDMWQINRWRSFVARHMGQIEHHCQLGDKKCHTKQRQGLLQWGWDSEHQHFSDKVVSANATSKLKHGAIVVSYGEFLSSYGR